jgi:hypothetical protein
LDKVLRFAATGADEDSVTSLNEPHCLFSILDFFVIIGTPIRGL